MARSVVVLSRLDEKEIDEILAMDENRLEEARQAFDWGIFKSVDELLEDLRRVIAQ